MSYKKFQNEDLFYNTIKAKPRFEFKIWRGQAVVNNGGGEAILYNLQTVEPAALIEPVLPVAPVCANPNSFDFSCEENSFNIATI